MNDSKATAAALEAFPPRWSRQFGLVLMLSLALSALLCTVGFSSRAIYSLSNQEVTPVSATEIDQMGATAAGLWVELTPSYANLAQGFTRFGESGSFQLTRDTQNSELYYVLRVPAASDSYIPPRVLRGRLITLADAPLADWALANYVAAQSFFLGENKKRWLVIEAENPASVRWTLPAALFSGILTIFFFSLAFLSFRQAPENEELESE